MTRFKSAMIVFIVLSGAIITAIKFDYTATYVDDRLHKALAEGRYSADCHFSLACFLGFHEFDTVCVVLPGSDLTFETRFGFAYNPKVGGEYAWSLVFTREGGVVAEVPMKHGDIGPPRDLHGMCFERWAAFVQIIDGENGPRMQFVDM
ncbi:hypothetical protein [Pseudodesulfovibrio piezophilus]|nr:hypothetical protein [Pseudodesulfovibrio piezophilus]